MKEPNSLEELMPIRPTAAELKAMALRQQQQIDTQQQLLVAKEQRLRFLKIQEAKGIEAAAEAERLRRLRERVEAQESKLKRLRALRGQVDLQKTYNVTLSNDLDSIRALFSEKEKELSLAVAKVEALTKQLEELRRDRRGPLTLLQPVSNGQLDNSSASKELENLRRELMYRNQLSLQQDAKLHMQREALQQRQAELHSVDQRILELQERLNKRKSSNLILHKISNDFNEKHYFQNTQAIDLQNRNHTKYFMHNQKKGNNVAAVEPFNHTPIKQLHSHQDYPIIRKPIDQKCTAAPESDENKLARKAKLQIEFNKINCPPYQNNNENEELFVEQSNKMKADIKQENLPYNHSNFVPKGGHTIATDSTNKMYATHILNRNLQKKDDVEKSERNELKELCSSNDENEDSNNSKNNVQLFGAANKTFIAHSTNLNNNKNMVPIKNRCSETKENTEEKSNMKAKVLHVIPSGNLVAPPRKPVSSVPPSTFTNITKMNGNNPKVHVVTPNVNMPSQISKLENDKLRPALPPKPHKSQSTLELETVNKKDGENGGTSNQLNSNALAIKARPLTIKKQPITEQPKLRSQIVRRSEFMQKLSPSELKESIDEVNKNTKSVEEENDEVDKSVTGEKSETETKDGDEHFRRKRVLTNENMKIKLARRVSFDPLALLLDASLEGELELVKKTAVQVPNPSAANDEGITALHNAICAGHFDIVKFLVEFGCDVNAQDSDGWTPLHCAASCNNLPMVKFLVESGACLFASTLSDHETPAEKCEEDEEGFDGCSEYLYNIQEKLGIMHNGEVYAVFSYDAMNADELSFNINDCLTIIRKGDEAEREWWWAKDSAGAEGYVPRNLLGLRPRILPTDIKDFE